MNERPEKRWSPNSIAMAVIVLLVLYVLSLPPVYLMAENAPNPVRETLGYFYEPIIWVYDNSEFADSFLDWYSDLWMDLWY